MKTPTSPLRRFSTGRVCLRSAITVLAALVFLPGSAPGAVTETWVHRYNNVVSGANDQAVKVVRDSAGDIIVTGSTNGDMLTIKYSWANGSVLWEKRYDGSAHGGAETTAMAVDSMGNVAVTGGAGGDYYTAKYAAADGALLWEKRYNGPANSLDQAKAVAVDGSGNVVVTGLSPGINGLGDYYTAKYAAADGALLWEKRYDGPVGRLDQANAVAVDGNGNVVVTGSSTGAEYSGDYYTAKYAAANGALLWEMRYHAPASSDARAVAVDGSGNVIVTGSSASAFYTAKYAASNGALLWEKRYNDPANEGAFARAVVVDGVGNVAVTGSTGSNGRGGDYYTAKYAAANGALLWEKRYSGPARDIAEAVAVDGSGNVVVTGTINRIYDASGQYDGGAYYTAKYAAADGALLWENAYHYEEDFGRALVVDSAGSVVVTGTSENDYYTARYAAADGALVWEERYDGPANAVDKAHAVAVDGSGNVVVTGISGNGNGDSYYTAKYAAANGALVWEKRYGGYGDPPAYIGAVLALDAGGNVLVGGFPWKDGNGYDTEFYTAKLSAADGTLLWERRYDGPAHANDRLKALAVDGSGNAVVAGSSDNGLPNFDSDYYTAKYAAADGALLWEKRYGGPGNIQDTVSAMAVDSSGNVLVTGTSYHETGSEFYTVKYASADGARLWEQHHRVPGQTWALAVDSAGNVAVTGFTFDFNHGDDYYTAKYAAADGALLWEKRYNGPANLADFPRAVAMDASGNVVVAGESAGDAFYYGYYTAKYAAADGALLWERRYQGAGAENRAYAVAVDDGGNVIVTGKSANGALNGDFDYYTAKYAAWDGTLLWEKRYNGPYRDNDTASSLALGPNGIVAVTGSSSSATSNAASSDFPSDYATVVYRDIPPASFADWATGFDLSGAAAGADSDPDNDGLPNSTEYVLGRNPALSGASGNLAATIDGGATTITFRRSDESETPDVILTVESGTDLATWPAVFHIGPDAAASDPGVSVTENGAAPDTITVIIPHGTVTRLFVRMKVTITP